MIGEIKHVHFLGICGTAMASVAAAMKERGYRVSGSDQNMYPPMSDFLIEKKIETRKGYSAENLNLKPDLMVIGNAISRGNPELEAVLERKLPYLSLPELLKHFFIQGKRNIVVTGTHGKTTVTSVIAWILECANFNPSYLIGGIPENFSVGARFTDSDFFVLEGDEYDTAFFDKRSKFVHYLPEIAVINNLEYDHADIFKDLASIQYMFSRMVHIVPRNGVILANGDEPNIAPVLDKAHAPTVTFGLTERSEKQAINLSLQAEASEFEIDGHRYRIPLIGAFNVRNALAATLVARQCGISPETIQRALETFKGVKRRQQVRAEPGGITIIDDFAHHPTAIESTIEALRVRYPGRRIWAVFEPRSNTTRRNVFQSALARSLSRADRVTVAQVARLEQLQPEERLDPSALMIGIREHGSDAFYGETTDAILDELLSNACEGDVIAILSNGGFDNLHDRLITGLEKRQ